MAAGLDAVAVTDHHHLSTPGEREVWRELFPGLLVLPGIEITLEANPGTVDAGHFAAYRAAGVNRLSIGVQSLSARHLRMQGRFSEAVEEYET